MFWFLSYLFFKKNIPGLPGRWVCRFDGNPDEFAGVPQFIPLFWIGKSIRYILGWKLMWLWEKNYSENILKLLNTPNSCSPIGWGASSSFKLRRFWYMSLYLCRWQLTAVTFYSWNKYSPMAGAAKQGCHRHGIGAVNEHLPSVHDAGMVCRLPGSHRHGRKVMWGTSAHMYCCQRRVPNPCCESGRRRNCPDSPCRM